MKKERRFPQVFFGYTLKSFKTVDRRALQTRWISPTTLFRFRQFERKRKNWTQQCRRKASFLVTADHRIMNLQEIKIPELYMTQRILKAMDFSMLQTLLHSYFCTPFQTNNDEAGWNQISIVGSLKAVFFEYFKWDNFHFNRGRKY